MKKINKVLILLLSIILVILIIGTIYYRKSAKIIKEEMNMQEIDVRLDDNLTQEQIEKTIENVKMLEYVNSVQNLGEGILIVNLTDLAKYEYVKSEIVKIDGVKSVN